MMLVSFFQVTQFLMSFKLLCSKKQFLSLGLLFFFTGVESIAASVGKLDYLPPILTSSSVQLWKLHSNLDNDLIYLNDFYFEISAFEFFFLSSHSQFYFVSFSSFYIEWITFSTESISHKVNAFDDFISMEISDAYDLLWCSFVTLRVGLRSTECLWRGRILCESQPMMFM